MEFRNLPNFDRFGSVRICQTGRFPPKFEPTLPNLLPGIQSLAQVGNSAPAESTSCADFLPNPAAHQDLKVQFGALW
jgi:hypothetical protein